MIARRLLPRHVHPRFHASAAWCALPVLLLVSLASPLRAQFSPAAVGLPQLYASSVAWGDFDNDGNLDIAIIGSLTTVNQPLDVTKNVARIYRNNGNGTFTEDTAAHLMPVCIGTIAWGDFDNDGLLDLVYGGVDTLNNQVTKLYHNDGAGQFTEVTSSVFHSSSYGCVAWGDFDNDGWLDILLSGVDLGSSLAVAKLYRNNHDGTFSEVTSAVLQGVNGLSHVSFGDYDNDGWPDILLNGRTTRDWNNPQSMSKLYHNNRGTGVFTEDTAAHFLGVAHGPTAFGDLNNDGFLDVLDMGVVGPAGTGQVDTAIVYLNAGGTGRFVPIINPGLSKAFQANVALGDYDGDGVLDILLNGYLSDPGLFKGKGDGTFTAQSAITPEVAFGGAAWGDFNGDGYFDALVGGTQSSGGADNTTLLRNSGPGTSAAFHPNSRPQPPASIAASVNGDTVTLSWARGTDLESPQKGLTYAVRVGSTPGGSDVVSVPAGPDGKRKVPALGAQGLNTKWTLRGLAAGTYYWSVQTVDNGYLGSTFATEGTFTVPVRASVKFVLQGPFSTTLNAMQNTLASSGVLAAHFSGRGIPSRAVDSVAIEIRDSSAGARSTVRLFAPAWLLTDGTICSYLDSTNPFVFFNARPGPYFIVVHHRNHIPVMSAQPVALGGTAPAYDFTTAQAQAFGSSALVQVAAGVFALPAGDVNQSLIVTAADANFLFGTLNQSGYSPGDVNLSGIVTAADANMLFGNLNTSSQVP